MPILGNLLVTLFGWLGSFFTRYVSKKVAFWSICATTVMTAYGVMLGVITAIMYGISAAMPGFIGAIMSWLIPSILPSLLAARAAAQVAIAIFKWQLNLTLAVGPSL